MQVQRYTALQRWLHWSIAALVVCLIGLGTWEAYFAPGKALFDRLDMLHEGIGVVVFALMLLRLLVRLARGAPPLPADTSVPIRWAAGASHFAFYALLLAQPVVGFLNTNANGFPLHWFGLVWIASPLGTSPAAAHVLNPLHWFIGVVLVLLIGMHVAAVLYHSFVRRDRLLARML